MSKITIDQKQLLVEFIEENFKFLCGKFSSSQGKNAKEKKWQEITVELNKIGPPTKEIEKWKKVKTYSIFHWKN